MGWSEVEDKHLLAAIEALGDPTDPHRLKVSWPQVEQRLLLEGINKKGKSCRLRFQNQLSRDINTSDMSGNEDEAIMFWVKRWGNRWAGIADLISIKSVDKGRRTDNKVKNRYNANLMATVVAPRFKAVKACKAGNATKKQRALIEDYLARLIDMREWVLSTQGIEPGPQELEKLDRRIRKLKALMAKPAAAPLPQAADSRNSANVAAQDPIPARAPLKRKRSPSPGSSPAESPQGGRGSSSPASFDPLPPVLEFQEAPQDEERPRQRRRTGHAEPAFCSIEQMLAECQWSADSFILDDECSMFQQWEQEELLSKHAKYLAATAAATAPEVAAQEDTLGAEVAALPGAGGPPATDSASMGSPPTRATSFDMADLDSWIPEFLEDYFDNTTGFGPFSSPVGMETGGW